MHRLALFGHRAVDVVIPSSVILGSKARKFGLHDTPSGKASESRGSRAPGAP